MKPATRELTAGIFLLWALLTGFFWLGYWVGGQEQLTRAAASVIDGPRTDSASPRPGSERLAQPEAGHEPAKQEPPARL